MQSDHTEALKQLAKECSSVEDIQEKLRDIFKDLFSSFLKPKWSKKSWLFKT